MEWINIYVSSLLLYYFAARHRPVLVKSGPMLLYGEKCTAGNQRGMTLVMLATITSLILYAVPL